MKGWALKTTLGGGNRFAGIGTPHDRYDEESGNPDFIVRRRTLVDYPHEPAEQQNGPVIIIKEAKKNE